jgi:hypothetical protein
MANSNIVHSQWASRPNDQRYLTVQDLYQAVLARRQSSDVTDVAVDALQVRPDDTGKEIQLVDTAGRGFGLLTHYSFGQLCQRAHAPAGYLRTLPAELAVIPLQWSLETHETEGDEGNDAKLLTRVNGHQNVAAVTSVTYGRIWDADVVQAVLDHVDLDTWKVPSASYSATDPKRATTLYASDRDVFIFLVNEQAGVDADGGSIKRGVYLWNSEVGSATFGIASFLYDYVCDNRIIWGQREFKELKIRHTSGGPHRFLAHAVPMLKSYAESSDALLSATIRAAKAKEVAGDKPGVQDWLKARGFTVPQAQAAYDAAERDPRGYNPRSVWGLVQGLTDNAKGITHTDDRVALEQRAGALLDSIPVDAP